MLISQFIIILTKQLSIKKQHGTETTQRRTNRFNYGSEHIQNVILNHVFEQTIFPIAIFSSEYTTEIDKDNTDMINAICWANAQFHSYAHRNNNLTSYNHTKTTPSHHKKQQQPNKPKFQRKLNKQKQTGKTHKFNSKKFHFKSKQATR